MLFFCSFSFHMIFVTIWETSKKFHQLFLKVSNLLKNSHLHCIMYYCFSTECKLFDAVHCYALIFLYESLFNRVLSILFVIVIVIIVLYLMIYIVKVYRNSILSASIGIIFHKISLYADIEDKFHLIFSCWKTSRIPKRILLRFWALA